ncbi:MAG: pectate lyase [Opitutus sp.]|nr:pectate lyase [Opitutus sp.]
MKPLLRIVRRRAAELLVACHVASAAWAVQVPMPVTQDAEGRLRYREDAAGNRVPDFSAAGYGGGGVVLPMVPAVVRVAPVAGDNTARLQAALNFAAKRAPDAAGWRGAVQLETGTFDVAGQLLLSASGVVLRGAGAEGGGTILRATGTGRRALIAVAGRGGRVTSGAPLAVADRYVSVGAPRLRLAAGHGLGVGETVVITRPSTKAWIERVGMAESPGPTPFAWKSGTLDLSWDRVVTAVTDDTVTLDAPITTALEAEFGGGTVTRCGWPGRIERVGIENLRCESDYDHANPRDEEHAWMAVTLDRVKDAWVRNVTAVHFVSSAVQVGDGARSVTVRDCVSLAPVSEPAGYRRHTFHTTGQLGLFERCRADEGRHDFTVGYLAAGPNVFLECEARRATDFSGAIGSWASGVLFDNVVIDGGALRLDNLETWNQGVGWAAANSMLWQVSAARVICRRPPGAQSWAAGAWAEFTGDGWWSEANEFVKPQSLYRAQLAARAGAASAEAAAKAPSFPSSAGVPAFEAVVRREPAPPRAAERRLALTNGWLVAGGRLLAGKQVSTAWWRGSLVPAVAPTIGPAITRFVPGRSGLGATDDLELLTDEMLATQQVAFRHNWGLWYDRRSDDHERVRRESADVAPPFFEQPWLRSGTGEAWDRLSRYDLARFNPWYFGRLREFAALGREKGLVLVNENYFQHNILEAGAHWAWFPWRSANNVNPTEFPEPPPYAGDKRIFMAEAFYDLSHPARRALHRAYIRQGLANLADEPNVIHTTGEEFSGPLEFVQFWFDVAGEWMAETGKRPLLALSAPKDVQDAILADSKRSALVSVIDLKYWWRSDQELYAPLSAQNLAPRQLERLWKGGKPSAASLAGMVAEYRQRFPDKAVISGLGPGDGWAFVAAGGSLPVLPATTEARLLAALPPMRPAAGIVGAAVLGDARAGFFVHAPRGGNIEIDLRGAADEFAAWRVGLNEGRLTPAGVLRGGAIAKLAAPPGTPAAFWLEPR